jgi:hypothetical protein
MKMREDALSTPMRHHAVPQPAPPPPPATLPSGTHRERFGFVVLAPTRWHGPWLNRQHIFSRLGTDHNVIYSNGAWSRGDYDTPEWRQATARGRWISADNVFVESTPKFLIRTPRIPPVNHLVVRQCVRRWRRQLKRLPRGRVVAYVYHPKFWPYVEYIGADVLVYHAYDRFDQMRGWNEGARLNQEKLLARADLIVASSEITGEWLADLSGRSVFVLPNAADVEHFQREWPVPADLHAIPCPRIGYVGSVNHKLDIPLIGGLAGKHPEWQFVLVGEVGHIPDEWQDCWRELKERRNVHLLGFRPFEQVAQYVRAMDVNIVPYQLSDGSWTRAGSPNKFYEYLASGQPLVSAELPSLSDFRDCARFASSPDDWEAAIVAALDEPPLLRRAIRRERASHHSWNSRVPQLERRIFEAADGVRS